MEENRRRGIAGPFLEQPEDLFRVLMRVFAASAVVVGDRLVEEVWV
jgi:hypothetical protein